MKRGLVVGEIWATRKAKGLDGRQLKLVVEYSDQGAPTGLGLAPLVVAVDTLDARRGQEVLIAYGSGARNVLHPGPHNRHELCDAAVAMLIDADSDPVPGPMPGSVPGPIADPGRAEPQAPASASPSSSSYSSSSLTADGGQAAGPLTKRGA